MLLVTNVTRLLPSKELRSIAAAVPQSDQKRYLERVIDDLSYIVLYVD